MTRRGGARVQELVRVGNSPAEEEEHMFQAAIAKSLRDAADEHAARHVQESHS